MAATDVRSVMNMRNQQTSLSPKRFGKKTYRLGALLKDVAVLLPRSSDIARIYALRDMSPALREAIMVAVARVNECRYCSFAHREWALSTGLDAEDLARVEQGDRESLDRALALAVEYARTLAQLDFGQPPLELEAALDSYFCLRERRDIETVARMMTVANLSGNTVDALLARLRGRPAAESRLPDELLLGAVFAVVAPVVVLMLSALRGRSPLSTFKAFRAFSEEFERAEPAPDESSEIDAAFRDVEAA